MLVEKMENLVADRKKCTKCKIVKPLTEYYILKLGPRKGKIFSQCKKCCSLNQKGRSRKFYPWTLTYIGIRSRCYYSKDSSYYKRGIKNYLTIPHLKFLWFRDKAYLMKRSSIDRIDKNKHYTFENCRYLELSENLKRR